MNEQSTKAEQENAIFNGEILEYIQESLRTEDGYYKYTRGAVEDITRAFMRGLYAALGTNRPVVISSFGVFSLRVFPARKMTSPGYKYTRKNPYCVQIKVKLTTPGLMRIRDEINTHNIFDEGKLKSKT